MDFSFVNRLSLTTYVFLRKSLLFVNLESALRQGDWTDLTDWSIDVNAQSGHDVIRFDMALNNRSMLWAKALVAIGSRVQSFKIQAPCCFLW
jgi:hypothetical protein